MDWKTRIRIAFAPVAPDDDIVEELAQHAAAIYAAARAEGLDACEADQRVDDQIQAWTADPALLRRRPKREPAVIPPSISRSGFGTVVQDVRYAWRLLRRQPGYAAVLIATMALGISATTVLGSLTYGVLLKPLPWADAPRLVRLYETRQGSTRRLMPMMTNATFLPWRDTPSSTLDALEAWSTRRSILSGDGQSQQLQIAGVTPGLLEVVGGVPLMGRMFVPSDAHDIRIIPAAAPSDGPTPVAIISYGLWQQRFGGAPDVLNQTLRLDGTTYSIVGVMPASFMFPDRATRAWLPFVIAPVTTPKVEGATIQMFQAVGRMRPGVAAQQVSAEGTARGRSVPPVRAPVIMAVFGSEGPVDVTAVPMLEALTGEVRPAILIMLAAVILLLLTATANAASLQLARATARRRELAIRTALGAGRRRLVRQTLVENVLVGVLGGAAGLVLAALMHRALPTLLPTDFPRVDDLALDARIQAFAVIVSIVVGLGCGLLPAWQVARADVVPALVEDALAPIGGGWRSRTARVRAVIMTAQVAIACVLLVGALLLVRSFSAMMRANLGYDATDVLSARVILPSGEFDPARRQQVVNEMLDRLSATRGVVRLGAATTIPFTAGEVLSSFPVKKHDGTSVRVQTGARYVSVGYFAALGQRVAEGRDFTAQDGSPAQQAAIVNREFSRRYLDGHAVGSTLALKNEKEAIVIVGVVDDTARHDISDPAQPEVYYPMRQQPMRGTDVYLLLRTSVDPRGMVPALRTVVHEAAPTAPFDSIMTMEDRVSASLAKPRLYAVLLGTFAAFALVIAGVGLFGVLSYTVAQRSREIGVRSALGAQVADIIGLVIRQSMGIAGAGITAGVVASLWLTRGLQKFLFGVTPHDFTSFAGVAVVLLVVAAIASVIPARRAARVDPVTVLRA
ncbi:MAG TPA: ABC transporter permease [Vicinamibacterales bacterium]|nr:ABC transporter permease [Vicinamibacterales bacterium]